jgi:hypothetical protein
MRDPDLIGRAQRAATELERAYDRWRTVHGLSSEPMPAVSSYVGYSLEEPWGQPRVVFGIEAREAEQLAALLERHECNGPVYAGLLSMPGARPEQGQELIPAAADRGRMVVPTQAQPTVAEREAAWREATWREAVPREQEAVRREQEAEQAPPGPAAAPQPHDVLGPAGQEPAAELPAMAAPAAGETSSGDEAEPGEASDAGGEPGVAAFRPQDDTASYAGEGDQDDQDDRDEAGPAADQADEPDDGGQASAGWSRPGRGRGHVLPRQRRGARGGAGKQGQG